MLKSIQYKIVLIFVLLTISIITVIGSFMLVSIVNFYNEEFSVMMNRVFTDDLVYQLEETIKTDEPLEKLSSTLGAFIGPLGIDTYRFYSILDKSSGEVLATSDSIKSAELPKTDNIILAMAGKRGDVVNTDKSFMDFALPLSSQNGGYIVYIKDTKEELNSITNNILAIVLRSLLIAILTAVVLGYLLGKTITAPITSLTKSARRLAEGEFDDFEPSKATDEIGTLSNSFSYMAGELSRSIGELREEKTKVETILQNMTDGILAFDLDQKLIHMNPTASEMFASEDKQNISFNAFFKKLGAGVTIGDMLYMKEDSISEKNVEYGEKFLRLTFAPIETDENLSGVLVVIRDITKQEKLELSRREFVSNVSHELRTPLTTVKSYAETLMDTSPEDEDIRKRFLGVIVNEADRMTRIVRDLLTLSRLDEAQNQTKEPEDIDLLGLLEGVSEKMFITAKKKDQTISLKNTDKIPIFKGDRDKLEQVIINIVSNAIKYTPDGGRIDIVSGRISDKAFIKVIDNGIGIPKENLSRIFERFYRVDKARSRDTGGTGLGLAIAKQMVDNMGGNITINSEQGKGTEVIITVPMIN